MITDPEEDALWAQRQEELVAQGGYTGNEDYSQDDDDEDDEE